MKYVFKPAMRNDSSRFSPKAGSISNSPFMKLKVFSEMCTRLWFFSNNNFPLKAYRKYTYPAKPLDSILLASSTSLEYTSNCHWRWPRIPAKIAPVWIPTRISTGEFVLAWTYLINVKFIHNEHLSYFIKLIYLIALTMDNPIWTQSTAWSGRSIGAPLMQ